MDAAIADDFAPDGVSLLHATTCVWMPCVDFVFVLASQVPRTLVEGAVVSIKSGALAGLKATVVKVFADGNCMVAAGITTGGHVPCAPHYPRVPCSFCQVIPAEAQAASAERSTGRRGRLPADLTSATSHMPQREAEVTIDGNRNHLHHRKRGTSKASLSALPQLQQPVQRCESRPTATAGGCSRCRYSTGGCDRCKGNPCRRPQTHATSAAAAPAAVGGCTHCNSNGCRWCLADSSDAPMVSHAEVLDVAKEGGRNMVHLQWDDGTTSWEAAVDQPGPLRV